MLLAVSTALILSLLRAEMEDANLDALIIPYSGAHYDEGVAACDARIKFVSGFGGSAGHVIVTRGAQPQALLWTDGRYFLQAEQTLDENWTLMKEGEPGVLTPSQFLVKNLTATARIGVDASTMTKDAWDKLNSELLAGGKVELVKTTGNLVNAVSASGNENVDPLPACPKNAVHALPVSFSGKASAEKLALVRAKMAAEGADVLVVSELDEVAWLFNLRGSDFPRTSVFLSFAIIYNKQDNPGFTYELFVKNGVLDAAALESLPVGGEPLLYEDIATHLTTEGNNAVKVWLSKYVNAELATSITPSKQLIKLSPIALLKSVKNEVEVQGMRDAHLRDSAAIIVFMQWLDDQILNNETAVITELSASEKLEEIRRLGENFVNLSFTPIAGYGANGAVIHYRATQETNVNISNDNLFLLDSGGLYLDGTTDITRTFHLGEPKPIQTDHFTRVLKGHIAIATAVFPNKLPGHRLDSFARKFLWDAHLDYKHGTGHGIGHYLNVHEGPQKVSYGVAVDDSGLEENMFISNEPGYYKDGEYGIRIENIVRVAASPVDGFLEIETVSFVPMQLKLINRSLLSTEEEQWIDAYHLECREKVGKFLDEVEYIENVEVVKSWLEDATRTLEEYSRAGAGALIPSTLGAILLLQIICFLVKSDI